MEKILPLLQDCSFALFWGLSQFNYSGHTKAVKEVLSLNQAILATFHYFDILDFPLTLAEIEEFLYGWSAQMDVIEDHVRNLTGIGHRDGFYFINGRESLVGLRKEREKNARKLWKIVARWGWITTFCPFVKMVAVCNSLAYGNCKAGSDIDLFIVTEDKHLYTARFFMKILTQLFGKRVHHDKIAGRFCLSFFVSESSMDLGKLAHPFDPHLAYFARTMTPLLGEKNYLKWLEINDKWTFFYFKRGLALRTSKLRTYPVFSAIRFIFESILRLGGRFLENWLFELQSKKDNLRKKALKDQSGVVITKSVFKFHEKDPRAALAERVETANPA